MELRSFDVDAGHHIDRFGSDFILSPLVRHDGGARTVVLHLPAGGVVGEHPAVADQLFCVVDGAGWVAGGDGVRRAIARGQAAHWSSGERHRAETDDGLVAVVIEGTFTIEAPRVVT
ncbi:MAG TPA: hypothetical protein VM143_00775 [Acidimicrobiales bacterium]|nr:hypothetical protein [Acidimicrobiales bacterium]